MNAVIDLLKRHRSIRNYLPDPVSDAHLVHILQAAQAASTSSNMQAYSVVSIRDPLKKGQFAELAGNQKHVDEAPLLLVWCADLQRIRTAVRLHVDRELTQNVELLLLASLDAALAAQNAAIATESLGYGIVYIGGIRNNPKRASELLQLPQLVFPVFGMCVGYPAAEPDLRPRLPLAAVHHEEVYSNEHLPAQLAQYDQTLQAYYAERVGDDSCRRGTGWTTEMLRRMTMGNAREHLAAYLLEQGFAFDSAAGKSEPDDGH